MPYIDQNLVFEKTDGGRTIIEALYPDSAESFTHKNRKFKSRGNEKTASTSLKLVGGVWIVTDFGGDQVSRNAIQCVMLEESCDFKSALNHIASKFNIGTAEFKPEVVKPVITYRDATAEETEGTYLFSTKPEFTLADAKHIIADKVWEYLISNTDKTLTPEQREEQALAEANKVFKLYHFHALNAYTIIKDRKGTIITATEQFPIYMFDEGQWKKIYKPKESEKAYRFTYYGGRPKAEFMFGATQAAKAYQLIVEIKDDDDMDDDGKEKKPAKKRKEKLSEIMLCTGGSDALNVALLGYHVVWLNSETAKLTTGQFTNLARMAERVYNIPDIDTTGLREAHRLAMDHLEVYTLYLPAELATKTDWRGNTCKDVRDYFRFYSAWNFRELLKDAMPYRFWSLKKEYNKAGEYIGVKFSPDTLYMLNFLRGNGFYRYRAVQEDEKYIYVYINHHVVKEVTAKDIRDFINQFLSSRHMEHELRNAFLRTTQLNDTALSQLPFIEIDFTDFTPDAQWMFFKNKVLKVTGDKIEALRPADCDKYVWDEEVLPHRVEILPDYFTITRDDETKQWDITINNKDCLVFRYLINASRIFWRNELEERVEGIPAEDQARYIESHNLTKEDLHLVNGLPPEEREKYLIENKWEINGRLLTADEKKEQKHHLINKIYTIGYLFHRFKNRSRAWCVWAQDNKITDGADSHGGSGKSLILNLISRFMKTEDVPGRNDKVTEDQHIFGNITPHTDMVFIDDCSQYLKFNFFFPCITGGISCNPKHGRKYTVDFKDSAKFAFASNYPPYGIDPSAERRILYMMFSDYYHYSQYDEYREERRVADDFGGKVLGDDFNETEWNLLINFFSQCLKFYLSTQVKINPPMDNVNRRNLKAEMTDVFQSWADVYFSEDAGHVNKRIVRKEAFEEFRKTTKQNQWSANKFLKSLKAWCRYNNCELNPKEEITDEKNNRIIMKVKVIVEGSPVESTEEMLFIKTNQLALFKGDNSTDTDEDLPF